MTDKTDRTAIALKTLEDGILTLTSSDEWARYLKMQAAFHDYSFNNVLLIMAQRSDATRVAGFRAWKKLGRSVQKGEKALWILAPLVSKVNREDTADAQDDVKGVDREVRRVVGFRAVAVFDVSQTEGDPLPAPVRKLTGDSGADLFTRVNSWSTANGCPVTVEDFEGRANGFYEPEKHAITVRAGLSPDQALKTLIHEVAHSILHRDPAVYAAHKGDAELEAESVAFVVLQHFGLDSGDYSFGYVAAWQGGGDEAIQALKSSAGRIAATVHSIIAGLELAEDAYEAL